MQALFHFLVLQDDAAFCKHLSFQRKEIIATYQKNRVILTPYRCVKTLFEKSRCGKQIGGDHNDGIAPLTKVRDVEVQKAAIQ